MKEPAFHKPAMLVARLKFAQDIAEGEQMRAEGVCESVIVERERDGISPGLCLGYRSQALAERLSPPTPMRHKRPLVITSTALAKAGLSIVLAVMLCVIFVAAYDMRQAAVWHEGWKVGFDCGTREFITEPCPNYEESRK